MTDLYHVMYHGTAGLQHLYTTPDNDAAQSEVDRINYNLAEAGIPSWVASAWVA